VELRATAPQATALRAVRASLVQLRVGPAEDPQGCTAMCARWLLFWEDSRHKFGEIIIVKMNSKRNSDETELEMQLE